MTANPERVKWQSAARDSAAPAGVAPAAGPKGQRKPGNWRIISADGSRRAASAAGAKPAAVGEPPEVRAQAPQERPPAGPVPAGVSERVNAASLLPPAPRVPAPSVDAATVKKPAAAPPKIAMPVAAPKLADAAGTGEPSDGVPEAGGTTTPPARQPGVDGPRAAAKVPIDAPSIKAKPSISVAAVGAALQASRGGSGSVTMNRGRLDPQLGRIMDAWPTLSARTRDAILAMVDVSLGKR